ncbi:MAG: hypothetical protein M0Z31_13295, partial [Clostridia bacterium]|nr:hypothetical protein [Clostridia bacterium]
VVKTLEGLFRKKLEAAVKAELDKATGLVKWFIWVDERKGELSLGHPDCRERALAFLARMLPKMGQQVELLEYNYTEENTDKSNPGELFRFEIRVNGLWADVGFVTIRVNRTTGWIDVYQGLDFDLTPVVEKLPMRAGISAEEALVRYSAELDVKLEWHRDSDLNQGYTLVYKPYFPRGEVRFVDALDGRMIRLCEPQLA